MEPADIDCLRWIVARLLVSSLDRVVLPTGTRTERYDTAPCGLRLELSILFPQLTLPLELFLAVLRFWEKEGHLAGIIFSSSSRVCAVILPSRYQLLIVSRAASRRRGSCISRERRTADSTCCLKVIFGQVKEMQVSQWQEDSSNEVRGWTSHSFRHSREECL